MSIDVKICGLSTRSAVDAAVAGGARYVGFVFFPPSPRSLTPKAAAALTAAVPQGVTRVGLVVDADDAFLAEIAAEAGIDMLQLHGEESPERAADIRERFGLPVIKAVPISEPGDVERAARYETVVDRLLFDARPPEDANRPGGNAIAFDWRLVRSRPWAVPWLLAGGLHAGNLAAAVDASGASAVDVSSGVEDAPGVKNLEKIRSFLNAARSITA